jgi:hypothetical protein
MADLQINTKWLIDKGILHSTHKIVKYLLLRQHVSALALGHHQVSNCVSEETKQCSMHIAHIVSSETLIET